MDHCYEHAVESVESVRRLVGESRDASFQLNERQCQILAEVLVETIAFLEKQGVRSKFGGGVRSISLLHFCATIKRAELLVKKCCCKDLESWLVAAMVLVEIQEEFVAIILDIHLWKMLLGFAITSAKGLSAKEDQMKSMDEEYHELFKDLHRESLALQPRLQQAAAEDKETIISKTSRIAEIYRATNPLLYLQAVSMQSRLTGNAAHSDTELRKWERLCTLGQGGFGTVFKVKWLGVECALKILKEQDEKEATALKGLSHPNIVRLFHYWEEPPGNPLSHLLMEFLPKDLSVYMKELLKSMPSSSLQRGQDIMPFSLPVAIDIMHQIALAMQYTHEKRLTHRDLKPSNILVKERPNVGLRCIDGEGYLDIKVADFGIVKAYRNTSTTGALDKKAGTWNYAAPEIYGKDLAQKRNYPPMADVWSFGIICAEILSGKEPYSTKLRPTLQTRIRKGLRPSLPKDCPSYLAFCIKSCWEIKPERRPDFASICKMLKHAKLLSLGVTNMDESKSFFEFVTRRKEVISFNGSSASSVWLSTFIQLPLRFMKTRVSSVPKIAEDLPSQEGQPELCSRIDDLMAFSLEMQKSQIPKLAYLCQIGKSELLTRLVPGLDKFQLHLMCENIHGFHEVAKQEGCVVFFRTNHTRRFLAMLEWGLTIATILTKIGANVAAGMGSLVPDCSDGTNFAALILDTPDFLDYQIPKATLELLPDDVRTSKIAQDDRFEAQMWLRDFLEPKFKNKREFYEEFKLRKVSYKGVSGSIAWICDECITKHHHEIDVLF